MDDLLNQYLKDILKNVDCTYNCWSDDFMAYINICPNNNNQLDDVKFYLNEWKQSVTAGIDYGVVFYIRLSEIISKIRIHNFNELLNDR